MLGSQSGIPRVYDKGAVFPSRDSESMLGSQRGTLRVYHKGARFQERVPGIYCTLKVLGPVGWLENMFIAGVDWMTLVGRPGIVFCAQNSSWGWSFN